LGLRSAELLSRFKCNLKTKLFNIAYSKHEHSASFLPLCVSDSLTTHGSI